MRNKKIKWTEECDNILLDSFHTSHLKDIARELGCSKTTVSNHARKLGLYKKEDWRKNPDARAFIKMEFENLSYSEMAKRLCMTEVGVWKIVKELGLVRTEEKKKEHISRGRIELVKSERRRIIFGLDQRTNLKLVSNKKRLNLKQKLKSCGYTVIPGENTIYYGENLVRRPVREANGIKLGLKFMPLPTETTDENYSQTV